MIEARPYQQAHDRGIKNLTVITADMNTFNIDEQFDRLRRSTRSFEVDQYLANFAIDKPIAGREYGVELLNRRRFAIFVRLAEPVEQNVIDSDQFEPLIDG